LPREAGFIELQTGIMGLLSSTVAAVSRLVTPALLLAAGAIAAYTFVSAIIWTPPANDALSEPRLVELLNAQDVVAAGLVTDAEGRTIPGASVVLALHGGSGDTLWRLTRPVGRDGTFGFRLRDLPGLPNIYPGTVAVEAPYHLSASIPVMVRIEATTAGVGVTSAQITPRRLQLHPTTVNP
jgi:hypothetical protein